MVSSNPLVQKSQLLNVISSQKQDEEMSFLRHIDFLSWVRVYCEYIFQIFLHVFPEYFMIFIKKSIFTASCKNSVSYVTFNRSHLLTNHALNIVYTLSQCYFWQDCELGIISNTCVMRKPRNGEYEQFV